MFPFLQFSVASKLIISSFDLYLSYRQHRRHAPHLKPSARVSEFIPLSKFTEAQRYCYAKSAFSIINGIIQTIIGAIMTLSFFGPMVWNYAATYANASELKQTLLFALFYTLIGILLDLPSSIYSTFVLEAKFGFNRTTVKTFVLDLVKQLVLTIFVGAPILSALYYVLLYLSAYNPISIAFGLWLLISVLLVIMMLIYPTIIAPMFNTFSPLSEGTLKTKLLSMASKHNFPLDKIYVIDGSRRSSHSNAYIFGLFKKYICIYDSLLDQTEGHDDQVISVLCHELGHWYHSHTVLGICIALVQVFITSLLYGLTAGSPDLFRSFGYMEGMPLIIGLMLFNDLLSPIDELITPLSNMLSRHFEYQADAFAKKQGMAADLGEALITMQITNLSNMSPDPLYSAWNYSHPTLFERLDALDVSLDTKKEK